MQRGMKIERKDSARVLWMSPTWNLTVVFHTFYSKCKSTINNQTNHDSLLVNQSILASKVKVKRDLSRDKSNPTLSAIISSHRLHHKGLSTYIHHFLYQIRIQSPNDFFWKCIEFSQPRFLNSWVHFIVQENFLLQPRASFVPIRLTNPSHQCPNHFCEISFTCAIICNNHPMSHAQAIAIAVPVTTGVLLYSYALISFILKYHLLMVIQRCCPFNLRINETHLPANLLQILTIFFINLSRLSSASLFKDSTCFGVSKPYSLSVSMSAMRSVSSFNVSFLAVGNM